MAPHELRSPARGWGGRQISGPVYPAAWHGPARPGRSSDVRLAAPPLSGAALTSLTSLQRPLLVMGLLILDITWSSDD